MNDENGDVDPMDTGENDVVYGGAGGYVDDDIDLDDDEDEDEPILKSVNSLAPSTPRLTKKRARPIPSSGAPHALPVPQAKRVKESDPHPNDFLLKAAGNLGIREYIIAKFMDRAPDLSEPPNMRLVREGEETAKTRKIGLEADKRQRRAYKTFTGSRKLERYRNLGITTVPDRAKKGWIMEVAPQEVADQLLSKRKVRQMKKASKPVPAKNEEETDVPETMEEQELLAKVDRFDGIFEGRNTRTRYAFMVMEKGSKTIEVYPVDDTSWFTFRAKRRLPPNVVTPSQEQKPNKKNKTEARLQKYQNRYEMSRAWREHSMGDGSRLQKHSDAVANFGLRRSAFTPQADDGDGGEALDFDEEFADDDVAQIDKEMIRKPVKHIHDNEKRRHDLKRMLKDEPIPSPPTSPRSDEEDISLSPRSQSPAPSASRPPSGAKLSPRNRQKSPSTSPGQPSSRPTSSRNVSPSPNRGSRGNTPKRKDLSHLVPPPGVLPSEDQVRGVLLALVEGKRRVTLNKVCSYFEIDTSEKKVNLRVHLKQIATFSKDPSNPKKVYIVPKSTSPPGSSGTT